MTAAHAIPLLLLLLPAVQTSPQPPPATESHDSEQYRISVDVDLVVLHTTVRDRNGRFAPGLRRQDFAVYEDGARQTIRLFRHEDSPVTVGLVIDHSGSMRRKMEDVISAARVFVRASNPEDEMFVVNFNEHVSLGLPDSVRFTNRVAELESAILKTPAAGMTALYDALVVALERLQAGSKEKRALVLVSDGGDNASRHKLAHVLRLAAQSSALVYSIGIFDPEDADKNPRVLDRLARSSGGEAYMTDEKESLAAVCERIAGDIRHQYTIGYVSTNPARTGAYRSIRVTAAAPGAGKLSVRARAGYIAANQSCPAREDQAK